MALETLKNAGNIGGWGTVQVEQAYPVTMGPQFVKINHWENTIEFKIQRGPVKEKGTNGCQIDTVIHAAKAILEGLNKNFPHPKNESAIRHLGEALTDLQDRTNERMTRGVEGTNVA